MAAEIVAAQASRSQMSPEEISYSLKRLFQTLKDIKCMEDATVVSVDKNPEETENTPVSVPVKDSIR